MTANEWLKRFGEREPIKLQIKRYLVEYGDMRAARPAALYMK
jgi:hypothetical protein